MFSQFEEEKNQIASQAAATKAELEEQVATLTAEVWDWERKRRQ